MSSERERANRGKVRLRRVKRWVKAAISIALAAAAGAFLTAATKGKQPVKHTYPDGGVHHHDAGVDREEHRKGMPVRDNLLE